MLSTKVIAVLSSLLAARLALADDCHMQNKVADGTTYHESDPSLCQPHGPNMWTFAMSTNMQCVPAPPPFDDDDPYTGDPVDELAGCTGGHQFYIYDENCLLRGQYDQPQCGIPWMVEENFLQWVLLINGVDFDVGSPMFAFAYGNGEYQTGLNQCGCQDVGGGIGVDINCGCAFPQDGNAVSRVRRTLHVGASIGA